MFRHGVTIQPFLGMMRQEVQASTSLEEVWQAAIQSVHVHASYDLFAQSDKNFRGYFGTAEDAAVCYPQTGKAQGCDGMPQRQTDGNTQIMLC